MADGTGNSITPFFTIWTEPRATMRRIVDTDPTRNVITLVVVGPVISALAEQWSKALNTNANLSVLWPLWVAVSVAFRGALGVLFLFIFGAVFKWSGSLLGGVASRVEVRAAIAWSQVPGIAAATVLLLAVLMGTPVPVPTMPGTLPAIDPAFYKFMVVEGVLAIWGFVVSLKCIGEVHRFSAWRALVAVLIPPLIVLLALWIIVFTIGRLMGHH
jgi:Yip1 domain